MNERSDNSTPHEATARGPLLLSTWSFGERANAAAGARRLRASTVKMLGELRVTRCLAQMARDARKKPFSEDAALLASLPGVQRYGWLLILQNQATAAEDAAKSWRDAMNAPIAPRTLEGDPGE